MTLLDSTSGNTGIAYAMLGAARDYRIKLTVPANVSPERMAILRAYGAELILTDPLEGSDGALIEARELAAKDPSLFYANQYNNAANWRAHYLTTAVEIWEQTGGNHHPFCGRSGHRRYIHRYNQAFKRTESCNPLLLSPAGQPI